MFIVMGKPQLLKMKTLLMVIILVFSYLISSDAARLSRHLLVTAGEDPSALKEEIQFQMTGNDMLEEDFVHGRMDIEEIAKNDYPGSGANNRHDPRTPGKI